MQYIMAIVPPAEIFAKADRFMRRWPANQMPDLIGPHITMKDQDFMTPDRKWLEPVRQACATFPAFDVSLGATDMFGDRVLFLSVQSERIAACNRLLVTTVVPPEEMHNQRFERFHPHMTLAIAGYGVTAEELPEMRRQADLELPPFPSFTVASLWLFEQKNNAAPYLAVEEIPLGTR